MSNVRRKIKIWFDITNTPQVNLFKPFINRLSADNHIIITVRDFAETVPLVLKEINIEPIVAGAHKGKNKFNKMSALINRFFVLLRKVPDFDISISCAGVEASLVSKIRGKKSIIFADNDIAPNWMYSRFVNYAFFPRAIPLKNLLRQGFNRLRLMQYSGYKEDIYIADYQPDKNFINSLPFKEYVLVRPENWMASYIGKEVKSIIPGLLKMLSTSGYNILYLPRYRNDAGYAYGIGGVYIPPQPINGLDACFFARAVISGGGTLTREAACLGRPSISIFAGKKILSVDSRLIGEKRIFYSRDVQEILRYIKSANAGKPDFESSRRVQGEVLTKLNQILVNI